jgi:hypothetical protein
VTNIGNSAISILLQWTGENKRFYKLTFLSDLCIVWISCVLCCPIIYIVVFFAVSFRTILFHSSDNFITYINKHRNESQCLLVVAACVIYLVSSSYHCISRCIVPLTQENITCLQNLYKVGLTNNYLLNIPLFMNFKIGELYEDNVNLFTVSLSSTSSAYISG